MKKLHVFMSLTAALACSTLTSCSLAQSATRLPNTILQTVGRTAGLVSHEANDVAPQQAIEVVGDGVIHQLD